MTSAFNVIFEAQLIPIQAAAEAYSYWKKTGKAPAGFYVDGKNVGGSFISQEDLLRGKFGQTEASPPKNSVEGMVGSLLDQSQGLVDLIIKESPEKIARVGKQINDYVNSEQGQKTIQQAGAFLGWQQKVGWQQVRLFGQGVTYGSALIFGSRETQESAFRDIQDPQEKLVGLLNEAIPDQFANDFQEMVDRNRQEIGDSLSDLRDRALDNDVARKAQDLLEKAGLAKKGAEILGGDKLTDQAKIALLSGSIAGSAALLAGLEVENQLGEGAVGLVGGGALIWLGMQHIWQGLIKSGMDLSNEAKRQVDTIVDQISDILTRHAELKPVNA